MADQVKYEGIPIKMGDKEYIVPPLNFRRMKALKPQIEILKNAPMGELLTDEQQDAMIEVIHAAVSRNYPEMTEDDLADVLDLGNVHRVIGAIYANSGLVQQEGGATAGSGLTGTSSTAT